MNPHTVRSSVNRFGYLSRRYMLTVGADVNIKPITHDLKDEHDLTNFVLINGLPDGLELENSTGEIHGVPEYATTGDIQIEISCEDLKFDPPDNLRYFTLEFNIEDVETVPKTPDFRDLYNTYNIQGRNEVITPTSTNSINSPSTPDFSALVDLSYKFKHEEWYFSIVLLFNIIELVFVMLIYYKVLFKPNFGYYSIIIVFIYFVNFSYQCKKLDFIYKDHIFEIIFYMAVLAILNVLFNSILDNYIQSYLLIYYYSATIIMTCVLYVIWKVPRFKTTFVIKEKRNLSEKAQLICRIILWFIFALISLIFIFTFKTDFYSTYLLLILTLYYCCLTVVYCRSILAPKTLLKLHIYVRGKYHFIGGIFYGVFYYVKKIISGYQRGKETFKIEKKNINDVDIQISNYTSPKPTK